MNVFATKFCPDLETDTMCGFEENLLHKRNFGQYTLLTLNHLTYIIQSKVWTYSLEQEMVFKFCINLHTRVKPGLSISEILVTTTLQGKWICGAQSDEKWYLKLYHGSKNISVVCPDWTTSTIVRWITRKFITGIHVPFRMNCNN